MGSQEESENMTFFTPHTAHPYHYFGDCPEILQTNNKNTVKVLAHLVIITLLWGILGVGSRGVLKVLPKSIYLAYAIEISLRMT